MWKCLDCKHFSYEPFVYYGGLTGWSPESLSCDKNHFWLSDLELEDLRKANIIGESCKDFGKLENKP